MNTSLYHSRGRGTAAGNGGLRVGEESGRRVAALEKPEMATASPGFCVSVHKCSKQRTLSTFRNKNAGKMPAVRNSSVNIPESYYTSEATICQEKTGKNQEKSEGPDSLRGASMYEQ
jgi:hypothetical protein